MELSKTIPQSRIAEVEQVWNCGSGTSLRHTPRAELLKEDVLKTFPQSQVMEGELREDISPRAKLLKPKLTEILPLEQNCGVGNSQKHFF